MSLFNMLHGFNPLAGVFLNMLGLEPNDCGRFRDAYLWKDEGGLRIHVYTRNGGGNRDEYRPVFEKLRQHHLYERDFDDDFDSTYATIVFHLPQKAKTIKGLDILAEEKLPKDKFKDTLAALKGDTPKELPRDVDEEKLKPVLEQIYELFVKEAGVPAMPEPGVQVITFNGTKESNKKEA